MEDRRDLIQWIKEHKKQLIIAGIGAGTLILIYLKIKNRADIEAVWVSLEGAVKQPAANVTEEVAKVIDEIPISSTPKIVPSAVLNSEKIPYEVSRHIRNLPDGWHASPEKVAEAMKNNIVLMDGQTWVDSYMKGGVAA